MAFPVPVLGAPTGFFGAGGSGFGSGTGGGVGFGAALLHGHVHIGEQHVAGQRGLAGTTDAGNSDQSFQRNVGGDVLQVVQISAFEF